MASICNSSNLNCENPICKQEFSSCNPPYTGSCGHTICKSCFGDSSRQAYHAYHQYNCPVCQRYNSFNGVRPHALSVAFLNTVSQTRTELEKYKKVVDEHELLDKSFTKCVVCCEKIEEQKARICKVCCIEEKSIEVAADNSVKILNMKKVDDWTICPSCYLDGPHKAHESVTLLPVKLAHLASTRYKKLTDGVKSHSDKEMTKQFNKLKKEIDKTVQTLSEMETRAKYASGLKNFNEIFADCEKQKQELIDHFADFECTVDDFVSQIKTVHDALKTKLESIKIPLTQPNGSRTPSTLSGKRQNIRCSSTPSRRRDRADSEASVDGNLIKKKKK